MQGPYPIFCRGHSGGRLVCDAFIRNGVDMGHVALGRKDTESFAITNPIIYEMILNAFAYWDASDKQRQSDQNVMKQCIIQYLDAEIQQGGRKPFGWKMGISLFTMPMLLDAFPTAKVIHLIRDGRDVMLSRLEARFAHLSDPVNRLVVFGEANVDHFEGHPLTPETIAIYRNELEMLHWVTAVRYGLKGRAYTGRYLEVKYEDICQNPILVFEQLFDFIGIPFLATTRTWLQQAVYHTRMAKWKTLSADELKKPLEIGGPLLRELGYLSSEA